jgi:hypothetical protein
MSFLTSHLIDEIGAFLLQKGQKSSCVRFRRWPVHLAFTLKVFSVEGQTSFDQSGCLLPMLQPYLEADQRCLQLERR